MEVTPYGFIEILLKSLGWYIVCKTNYIDNGSIWTWYFVNALHDCLTITELYQNNYNNELMNYKDTLKVVFQKDF